MKTTELLQHRMGASMNSNSEHPELRRFQTSRQLDSFWHAVMGKQTAQQDNINKPWWLSRLLNHRSCLSAILCGDGLRTFWCMRLFCLSNCKRLLWGPGENYKKIRFLPVLDKICTGEKGIKKESICKIMLRQEPEGTLHILRVKNIHLGCFRKRDSRNLAPILTWKQLQITFRFMWVQSVTSMAGVPGAYRLPLWNQRISPVYDSQHDKWLIMVISWVEHLALLCARV